MHNAVESAPSLSPYIFSSSRDMSLFLQTFFLLFLSSLNNWTTEYSQLLAWLMFIIHRPGARCWNQRHERCCLAFRVLRCCEDSLPNWQGRDKKNLLAGFEWAGQWVESRTHFLLAMFHPPDMAIHALHAHLSLASRTACFYPWFHRGLAG